MDEEEIKRLRKEICRSFGSSPHKKRYWLALLDMYVEARKKGQVFCTCTETDAAQCANSESTCS